MDNFTLQPYKFVKILSNITIGIAVILSVIFGALREYGGFVLVFIFLFLGLLLCIAYKKEFISFGENEIFISKAFRKPQICSYEQIDSFLIVPMSNQFQYVLAEKNGERITAVENMFSGIDVAIKILKKHGIKIVDIGELIDAGKPVDVYLSALTKIQRNNVLNMLEMERTAEDVQKDSVSFELDNTKKRLRIFKIALCLMVVIGFFIDIKVLLAVCIAVLLLVYGLYVKYYPYMYMETIRSKVQNYTLQLPFIAPGICMLILVIVQEHFSFELLIYLTYVFFGTIILYLPFLLKVKFQEIQTHVTRMVCVFFAVLVISYVASFPLNVLLTFNTPVHTEVSVTGKTEYKGRHDDWYIYVDNGMQFNVTEGAYQEIEKGDSMRVCTRKSMFGFKYSSLHK